MDIKLPETIQTFEKVLLVPGAHTRFMYKSVEREVESPEAMQIFNNALLISGTHPPFAVLRQA